MITTNHLSEKHHAQINTLWNEEYPSTLVDRKHQGLGYGKQLINALKNELPEFYSWVVDKPNFIRKDGSTYPSPLSFYLHRDFNVVPEQRIDSDMISAVKVKFSNGN